MTHSKWKSGIGQLTYSREVRSVTALEKHMDGNGTGRDFRSGGNVLPDFTHQH